MWNLSSDDVQQAKERIKLRRAELEARYAAERATLDAEDTVIETLERSASEFARKYAAKATTESAAPPAAKPPAPEPEAAAPQPDKPAPKAAEPAAAAVAAEPVEPATGLDAKHGSRWRLHLGSRPEAEGHLGTVASR